MKMKTHVDVDVVAVEQDDQVSVMLELDRSVRCRRHAPAASGRAGRAGSQRLDGRRAPGRGQAGTRWRSSTGWTATTASAWSRSTTRSRSSCRRGRCTTSAVRSSPHRGDRLRRHDEPLRRGAARAAGGAPRRRGGRRDAAAALRRPRQLGRDGPRRARPPSPPTLASAASRPRRSGSASATTSAARRRSRAADRATTSSPSTATAPRRRSPARSTGLLSKTVQAARLLVRPTAPVEAVTVWNDLPRRAVDGGVMIELGDLWSGEQRKLVLTFDVPARPALGLAADRRARAALRRAAGARRADGDAAGARQRRPGRRGRRPDPRPGGPHRARLPAGPRGEALGVGSAARRRRAPRRGAYDAADNQLSEPWSPAPRPRSPTSSGSCSSSGSRAQAGDVDWAAKFGRMDQARKSRRRGRGAPGCERPAGRQEQLMR